MQPSLDCAQASVCTKDSIDTASEFPLTISQESLAALRACQESADRVHDIDAFKQWIRTDVRNVLPHGACACVHGRLYGVGVSPDYVVAVDYPLGHLLAIRNASGHMDTPLAERWYAQQSVVFFDACQPWPELSPAWLQSFREHGLRNAVADGVLDRTRCIATYFSFHRLPVLDASELSSTLVNLTPVLHETLVRVVRGHETRAGARSRYEELSERERAVAAWVAKGKSNAEVAQLMGLAQNTVKHYLTRILDKVGCSNRAALAVTLSEASHSQFGVGTKVL